MIEIVSDKTSINFASILIFGGSKLNQRDEVKSCFIHNISPFLIVSSAAAKSSLPAEGYRIWKPM